MATNTPNYGFIKPAVNDQVDANLWGTETNTNWDTLDTDLKAVSNVANTGMPLVGDLKPTARATAPALWLLCNGAAVSRSTYSDLFLAIGTTFGSGDGTTTFNLPDAGGRTLVGKETVATRLTSAVSGVDGATLGASGGNQNVQQHTHTAVVTDPGHTHTFGAASSGGSFAGTFVGPGNGAGTPQTSGSRTTGITVANSDYGTGSSANVQPTLVINWLIYAGV